MDFIKLVDRAEVICNADRGLLFNLLYDAEEELARECNVLEGVIEFQMYNANAGQENIYLPGHTLGNLEEGVAGELDLSSHPIYKKMISVHVDGHELECEFENNFRRDNNNQLYKGTPTHYCIENNILKLSHKAKNPYIRIKYYGIPQAFDNEPSIPLIYHKDLVYYACYIATLKKDANLAQSYLAIWNEAIRKIKTQEGDREMVNKVREVI